METRRPPPNPPDACTHNNVAQSQTVVDMVMHLGAKNANDPPQNGVDPMNIPNPAVTAVTCEAAAKQSNALHSPLLHFESSVSDRVDFISSARRNSNSKGKNPGTIQQKGLSTSSSDDAAQHRTYASDVSFSKGNHISGPNSAFPCLHKVDTCTALQRCNNSMGEIPTVLQKKDLDKNSTCQACMQ
jgi:hypothetical protein